jgi:hypothetical protein
MTSASRRRAAVRCTARALRALAVAATLGVATPASAQSPEFDHDLTRFPLDGMHDRTPCESCHVGGRFTGTPTACGYCHDGTTKWAITAKQPTHVPTTAPCEDCHTTRSWLPARMDHADATDRCDSCHNGTFASGRPGNHVPASNQCGDCHGTVSWLPARFDHANVGPGSCATCHNGVTATGKHPGHVASSNQCDLCHTTLRWSPASGFDHSGVAPGSCSTCHDGMTATGKHSGHIASSNQCDLCHSTQAWLPATGFDHAGVAPGSCATCHNGVQARGKGSGHFVTTLSCDECHSTLSWTRVNYVHAGAGYPGDHQRNLDCLECHTGNSQVMSWPFAAYQPDCAGCHANDYESGPHEKHENPDVRYSVSELRDCSGSCHVYTDSTLSTIKDRRDGEHRVSDSEF